MSVHDFEFATLMFDEENMVLYINLKQGIIIDIYEIREIISCVWQILGDFKHYVIINFESDVEITLKARELYSKASYVVNYHIANAFVVDSLALRIAGNFFIKVTKPTIPTKIFKTQEDALKWIKTIPLK